MAPKIPVEQVIVSFLRHCDENAVPAMVLYGAMTPSGPALRIKSNQPEGPTAGILKMLQGLDDKAITAGARALHSSLYGGSWEALTSEGQVPYIEATLAALTAAKAVAGATVDTQLV